MISAPRSRLAERWPSLRGRRALVTGAGTRLGAAIATALGEQGAKVAVHYRSSAEGADAVVRSVLDSGGDARGFHGDLLREGVPSSLVADASEWLGGMDILVANAANFDATSVGDANESHWDRALELNLRVPFRLVQSALPFLRQGSGAVVLISDIGVDRPYRDHLPYLASKGALSTMARTLALELAPDVRVNAVAPGTVLAPLAMGEQELAAIVSRV
ncbi:MAG: SDR family NAD(P)-dependent oxidoreductase, partial [Myxococcales bacterium]|nr:SDR family NAD(P)-dependent oxidoreductase [Myxococcales bacterium]